MYFAVLFWGLWQATGFCIFILQLATKLSFSFQLEECFHPVASFGCFSPAPSEAVAQQPARFCGWGVRGGGGTGWPSAPAWGRGTFPSGTPTGPSSKQNIFSMKELLLRQLVFWSGITECTSQQTQNTLLFQTRPFPTRSATNVLLFSHLGHVGNCVLRELAGRRPGEGARLDECCRAGA